ncbi:hypothetical protein C1H46_023639 [Malus baccata]|uniref:Uncharacterized protein n=1 Tax=Malus baccata TaxID=106549 RepID=A0A540LWU3_MALBA|nr:hypothetical protein C1H46_023639 [Malus baccata]
MMKGAIVYLESNDEVKDEQSGKRVKHLENNEVQARVNIVLLVDDFLNEALTYLGAEEIAKAKNVIEGMKLFVSQCDEIKDKAATFEEMIQRALTFIEHDRAGHAEGVKYLEQDKAERGIQKAIFVTEVLKVALTFIDKKQPEQAKEVVEGVVMYVALDDTVKDKVGSTKVILDGIMTLFQLDRVEKAKEAIQGTMTYLLGDEDVQEADKLLKSMGDEDVQEADKLLKSMGVEEQNKLVNDVKDKTATKLKRMKFLENNKVQARVNIVLLVDDFLNEALTYLGGEEIAKAKNVIEGMKLVVSQCDEIKDKAAAFEEMIQRALTFIEQDSLEKAKEVINEAMTYLGNDDDVKELRKAGAGHAKEVKYLEQDKAERGIQKAIFVAEILDGIMTLFQLDRMEKAKEAIQGTMTYLLGDEDVQEADKLLKSMGVEEQNKLVKDVKDKTAVKLKRMKFLENGGDGVGKLELVDDFVQGALIFLEKSKTEKAKEMIDGAVMCFHQDDTGKDKEAKFEGFMKEALTYLEQENKAQAEDTLKRARDYLVTEDAANDKGSEL